MKVKETYNEFTNYIFTGFNAYHILCDSTGGIDMTVEELISLSKHYYRICFLGDTKFFFDEITDYAKKIAKVNENALVQVFADGTTFSSLLSKCENVIFIVAPELDGEKPYDERIKKDVLKKYAKSESFFIFNVDNKDYTDKISFIITDSEIDAYLVFIIGDKEYAKSIGANVIC